MGIIKTDILFINKFIGRFSLFFSKKQMTVFLLCFYTMFKDYKRTSLFEMAKVANVDYQRFQYFFCDSKWDLDGIRNKRLEIIENQLTTASTSEGILAIDDTGCPKASAKKTEGAKYQYCGPLKRREVCNVVVASTFVSSTKHFPVDIMPYMPASCFDNGKKDPQFMTKIEIAKALIDKAIESDIKFSSIGFDSWYGSSEFIEYLADKKKLKFFSEIKSNRSIFMFHPVKKEHCVIKPDELVTLIRKSFKSKIRRITYKTKGGAEVCLPTYAFKAKLNDCDVALKFLVVLGKWNEEDDKKFHILITNQLEATSKSIMKTYLLRWGIEHCFKELKDTFNFDQYQVRHIKRIERYWNLCLLAWTLVYTVKQNAYLHKILETKPLTFNGHKSAINSLIDLSSVTEILNNKETAKQYIERIAPNVKKKAA